MLPRTSALLCLCDTAARFRLAWILVVDLVRFSLIHVLFVSLFANDAQQVCILGARFDDKCFSDASAFLIFFLRHILLL